MGRTKGNDSREVAPFAKISCVVGALAFLTFPVGAPHIVLTLASIAVVTGHIARSRISKDNAIWKGSGMTLVGLILGYLSALLTLLDWNAKKELINRAKTRRTQSVVTACESAITSFHLEYNYLPSSQSSVTTNTLKGIELLTVLLGYESTESPQNKRKINFLAIREGKNRKNGLIYSASGNSINGLFDPWGNPYTVVINTKPTKAFQVTVGRRTFNLGDRLTAVYSPGPDQQAGTRDDIRTW